MPRRPNPRAVALENAAFLRHLRRAGNAHEAARLTDASRSRFTKRRAKDPAFAVRWDAALAWAQASLSERAGRGQSPSERGLSPLERPRRCRTPATPAAHEPHLVRLRSGAVQLRRLLPTAISPEAEAAFLLALAATANVRLSARAAGFASASFYARKRRNPGFAREWQKALALGYDRLELALLEGWSEAAHEHDAWAHNDPPPIPPMNAAQALQLMYLHQKEARALAPPEPLRLRPGETNEARVVRLTLLHEAWMEREREKGRVADAARRARGERSPFDDRPDPHEPPRPTLPDLAQVTGWSRACPEPVEGARAEPAEGADPDRAWDITEGDVTDADVDGKPALFGGWRIEEMRRRMGEE